MSSKFLTHTKDDAIGMTTEDVFNDEEVERVFVDLMVQYHLKASDKVVLGHKITLRNMKDSEEVFEYSEPIGETIKTISKGAHLYAHNIKSKRWH